MTKKIYKIASLFSGCGGLDLGFTGGFNFLGQDFKKLNTKIVFANDFDEDACKCYTANSLLVNDDAHCLLDDIRNIDADKIPDFDILLAGFPCQPFSNAGNRKGVHDSRGMLYKECLRIIRRLMPKVIVFENVKGLLSTKYIDGRNLADVIISDLSTPKAAHGR